MTLSIQFHAMPEEHMALMSKVLNDPNLWVSEYRTDQPAFRLLDRAVGGELQASVRALVFTAAEPNLSAATMHQFLGLNPDALVLDIGRQSASGLAESGLSSHTRDEELTKRWRGAAKQLKGALHSGAIAINPATGETAPMTWHRFTRKAQEAYAAGTVIRPTAGTSIIKLPNL